MNGNKIIVHWDGDPIAAAKSAEISTGVETIETASPTSGAWRTYIAGRKEWSATVSYLVLADEQLVNLLSVGTTYTLKITGEDGGYLTGSALLTTCKVTATRGNLVNGSFSFKGTSALTAVNLTT